MVAVVLLPWVCVLFCPRWRKNNQQCFLPTTPACCFNVFQLYVNTRLTSHGLEKKVVAFKKYDLCFSSSGVTWQCGPFRTLFAACSCYYVRITFETKKWAIVVCVYTDVGNLIRLAQSNLGSPRSFMIGREKRSTVYVFAWRLPPRGAVRKGQHCVFWSWAEKILEQKWGQNGHRPASACFPINDTDRWLKAHFRKQNGRRKLKVISFATSKGSSINDVC